MARDVDYANAMRRALARHGIDEDDHGGERLAKRLPASVLTISDIAEALAGELKTQKREILAHVSRLLTLLRTQQRGGAEDTRIDNLHRRLCALESEVRRGKR